MQPKPSQPKQKYRIKDFISPSPPILNKLTIQSNKQTCKIYCLCNQFQLSKSIKCTRCRQSYHQCVANKIIDYKTWQCLHCLSKYMDPIYVPQITLIQTFFKTQLIYQYTNIIQFIFNLTAQQLKNPVEIRGLQDGRTGLAWPMHGQFYLNSPDLNQPILDLKPLLKNSNRKYRKQQALLLPQQKLKLGKNTLIFHIPKLNINQFQSKYQVQQRGIYFFGIYSIKKLQKQQLIHKTFNTSKITKIQSLQLLKKLTKNQDPQLSVQKIKLSLECPYMKSRIKIPIRGKKCYHFMVICLDTLIQTRSSMNSRQWLCPICSSDINQPVIDMFIFSILNDGSTGIQVMLSVTGEYSWVSYEDDNLSISSDDNFQKPKQPLKNTQIKLQQKIQASKSQTHHSQKKIQVKQQPQKPIPQIQKIKQTKNQKTINIDDQPSQTPLIPQQQSLVIKTVQSSLSLPSHQKQSNQLQIMIPLDKKKSTKQKQLLNQREKRKNKLKQLKKQSNSNQLQLTRINPKKNIFLINDMKQIQFKPLSFHQFNKKYFNFEFNRAKINQDLRIIFKQIL